MFSRGAWSGKAGPGRGGRGGDGHDRAYEVGGGSITNLAGSIQSGALESSNVDLTTQLVDMITAQRAFQANAQVITTANAESQTIINIGH